MIRTLVRAASIALVAAAPAAASAQAGGALPPAKDLVAKYVQAIGGRDAVLKHSSIKLTGRFEMPAAGVGGDLELVRMKPNLMVTRINIPGMGEVRSGYNGTVGWSINPMQGPRLAEGKELAALQDQADLRDMVKESPSIASMETVEKTTMGGEECYKVKVTYKSGRDSFECYSVASGLIVGGSSKEETPMGSVEMVSAVGEYKEFGGIKFPTRITQEAMGQQQVMSISNVEFDTAQASHFELPAEIKALAEKAPAKPGSQR